MDSDHVIMPFGPYRGEELKDIPLTDLDKAVGWMEDNGLHDSRKLFTSTRVPQHVFYKQLVQYLADNHY